VKARHGEVEIDATEKCACFGRVFLQVCGPKGRRMAVGIRGAKVARKLS